jgi:hypothetical protein
MQKTKNCTKISLEKNKKIINKNLQEKTSDFPEM